MIRRIILAVLLVLACAMPVLAGVSVSGKVIDAATNEPLIGATIIVPEDVLKKAGSNVRNVNALTDIDGNFTITLPDGVDFMECRYVGYTPERSEIKGDVKDMLIAMTSSTTELERGCRNRIPKNRETKIDGFDTDGFGQRQHGGQCNEH